MDIVLEICDDLVFDKLWAHLVPLSAFANTLNTHTTTPNGSSIVPTIAGSVSTSRWSHIISYLPHPPLPTDLTSAADLMSFASPPMSAWPRTYVPRQLLSLFSLTWLGIIVLYFIFAGLSYRYIFNHDMMRHPRFLKNQVKLEIQCSLASFPMMTILTLPWFQAEVMGYSKLYKSVDEYGWTYFILSVPLFLFFTDLGVYFAHRALHHPVLYKTIHKPHHKWLIPTPFASHAFHPVDGYLQSIPYHVFIFCIPLHRVLYLGLFIFVNFWTIFIHDSDMITGHPLEKIINGPAHHTLHHLYFTVNYGQYFTWADRVGKSYRQPEAHLDPLLEVKPQSVADEKKKL